MAASYAEVWTQIKNATAILDDIRTDGTDSLVTKLDTFVQSAEGDYAPDAVVAARRLRDSYASLPAQGRGIILPLLNDMATAIASDEIPPSAAFWDDLIVYMIANSSKINSRDISFGSVSADVGNVGTGTVYRLTINKYNQTIENVYLDKVYCKVVQDQNNGTQLGREVLEIYHEKAGLDVLSETGSRQRGTLTGIAGSSLLRNASFETFSGTASVPTAITGWTVTDGSDAALTVNGTNFGFDSTNYFRFSPEERSTGTAYALNLKATGTTKLKQVLRGFRAISDDTPYVFGVRFNRQVGSGAGTLYVRLGAESTSVSVSAQTGWNTLILPIDDGLWKKQFNADNLTLSVEWVRTSGELLIDDVFFGPMTQFDNLWYAFVGGATHALVGDFWTFSDSLAGSDAKIQAWFWRLFNVCLPAATGGTETITDPS